MLDLIIGAGLTGTFLAVGWIVGSHREKEHFNSLDQREEALSSMLISDLKSYPMASGEGEPTMYVGQAVIASDYLKTFVAGFVTIFGGNIRAYETLTQRARREALLRVQEQAHAEGYNAVCNIRFDTSDISSSKGKKGVSAVEMICIGTAYHAQVRSS